MEQTKQKEEMVMEKTFVHGNKFWVSLAVSLYISLFICYGSFMEYKAVQIKKLINHKTHNEIVMANINECEIAGVQN